MGQTVRARSVSLHSYTLNPTAGLGSTSCCAEVRNLRVDVGRIAEASSATGEAASIVRPASSQTSRLKERWRALGPNKLITCITIEIRADLCTLLVVLPTISTAIEELDPSSADIRDGTAHSQ